MKKIKLYLLFIITLVAISCTNKKDGWTVKAQDGKFYKLRKVAINEAYALDEIDTTALNLLMK